MKKTYFEKEVGIKKEVFSEKKHLYLSAFGKGSKAEVDFLFEYGPDNAQDAKELWALSDYLTKNSRGGLVALLRYSEEADEERKRNDIVEDGLVGGTEGNFSSTLEVKGNRLLYSIEMCSAGCMGSAQFDLGLAYRGRVTKISKMVAGFEDYLISFVYVVKHHYIDYMD